MVIGQPRSGLLQAHRVGRRMFEFHGARRRDDADRAETGGAHAHGRPDLAHETGNRRLAAGAGDGDDQIRLAAEEARCCLGEGAARIGGGNAYRSFHRHTFPHKYRASPGGDSLRNEFCSVNG